MNKNKTIGYLAFICATLLCILLCILSRSCSQMPLSKKDNADTIHHITAAEVASKLTLTSKIYTSEVEVHKTMHYTSDKQLDVSLFGTHNSINLPLTHMEAYIPVTVKYSASIPLDKMNSTSFRIINDTTIMVALPDPVIEQKPVSVDYEKESVRSQTFAKVLDDKTYQGILTRAKNDVEKEITNDQYRQIIDAARTSAAELLLPMLQDLGFKKIDIGFSKNLDTQHPRKLLQRVKD